MSIDESTSRDAALRHPRYAIMVLLVDDQPMVGEAVRRALLNEPDMEFHYCADPPEAIAVAKEIKPTVILQDLVMPGVDGLDLVRQYRADPATSGHPDHRALEQGRADGQERCVHGRRERLSGQAAGPDRADRPHPLSLEGISEPAAARRSLPRAARKPAAAHGDEPRAAAFDQRRRPHRAEQPAVLQRVHGGGMEARGARQTRFRC